MKASIKLEDEDIDRIATAVAAKIGKPAAKAAKAEDETETETETETEAETDTDTEAEDIGTGEETETETEVTVDDVRKALQAVVKKFDNDTAVGILKKVGGSATLSKLKPAKFQAVIDAAKKKAK